MFTSLAIGATLIAIPMVIVTIFARRMNLKHNGKPWLTIEGLPVFVFMVLLTSPVCALAVYLWHKALS